MVVRGKSLILGKILNKFNERLRKKKEVLKFISVTCLCVRILTMEMHTDSRNTCRGFLRIFMGQNDVIMLCCDDVINGRERVEMLRGEKREGER